ncbi:nuclear transport factor 2 family protein [Pseudomonas sp. PICF141]|uniref:nuclear transport factor 2 family protein n=1 Tax=Pseudomonas sp. PICF141 TaxID=1949067 RepID=UPI0021140C1B|nr:nuclear transport factor 2 family protein [Pseudomonas sp. PICF141]
MPDRHALTQVVEAAYAAFAARQPQQLLPLCTQDCCWQAPGLSAFMPWVGEHHGHAGVLAFIAQLDQHLEFLGFTPSSLVVDVVQGAFREYPDTAAQLAAIHPALNSAAAPEESVMTEPTPSGLQALRALIRGELPGPSIGHTMGLSAVAVEPGRITLEARPDERHLNCTRRLCGHLPGRCSGARAVLHP